MQLFMPPDLETLSLSAEELRIFHIPRLHTAIAEALFCLIFILMQKKRLPVLKTVLLYAGYLVVAFSCNLLSEFRDDMMWLLLMAVCMGSMFGILWLLCRVTWEKALFCWAYAFLAAELAASTEWEIIYYLLHTLRPESYAAATVISYVVLTAVYLLVAGLLVLAEKKLSMSAQQMIHPAEAVSVAGITLVVFFFSNLKFAFRSGIGSEAMTPFVLDLRTAIDLCGIILLYAYALMRRSIQADVDRRSTALLLERQYEQYQLYRQNNEYLHRVYHDLKHQLSFIQSEQDPEKRAAYLREIKQIIRTHDADVQTGNPVIDTLLGSKNLICMQKQIQMTCVADASALKFMDTMDVCAIFGNALDNAIEYEENIPDLEKRLIKVTVRSSNALIRIQIENYCETGVLGEEPLPPTTKEDKHMHGHGLSSIFRTAQKYGGHASLKQEDNWFSVAILIPQPPHAQNN